MTAPFQAITGLLRGTQRRRQDDLEADRYEQQRQDRIAAQQSQMAAQAEERDYRRKQDEAVATRQRAMDERQTQGDMLSGYEKGFMPLDQVQEQGRQASRAGEAGLVMPINDMAFSGVTAALRAGGQAAQQARPVYSVGGTPMAKGRFSEAEQAREDQQEQARLLRDSQSKTQMQMAADALRSREDIAREQMQGRREIAGMMQANQRQPSMRAQMPTEGERKASAFYISGKQGYDTMEALLAENPKTGKANAVPSWWGQQAAKVGMGGGNVLTNDQTRQLRQAANQMADAWLRYTSGAAVPEREVERFGQSFIPEPGDDPVTLKQKADARRTIMEALKSAGGRALPDQGPPPGTTTGTRPPLGSFQK